MKLGKQMWTVVCLLALSLTPLQARPVTSGEGVVISEQKMTGAEAGRSLSQKSDHPITSLAAWHKEERLATGKKSAALFGVLTTFPLAGGGLPHMVKIERYSKNGGLVFFASRQSIKAQQLLVNLEANLTFSFSYQDRYIGMEGRVEELSHDLTERFWNRLSLKRRVLFLASEHVGVLESPDQLQHRRDECASRYKQSSVCPMPAEFVVYRFHPHTVVTYEQPLRGLPHKEQYEQVQIDQPVRWSWEKALLHPD